MAGKIDAVAPIMCGIVHGFDLHEANADDDENAEKRGCKCGKQAVAERKYQGLGGRRGYDHAGTPLLGSIYEDRHEHNAVTHRREPKTVNPASCPGAVSARMTLQRRPILASLACSYYM